MSAKLDAAQAQTDTVPSVVGATAPSHPPESGVDKASGASAGSKAARSNILSAITFSYLNKAIVELSAPDSDASIDSFASTAADGIEPSVAHEKFMVYWKEELQRTGDAKPSLLRALRRAFIKELLFAAGLKLIWGTLIVLCASYFIRALLSWLQSKSKNDSDGWVLSCCLFATCFILSVALQQMAYASSRLGLRVRAALSVAVYRKSLVEDRTPESKDVVSLIATDCNKLHEAAATLNYLWSAAVEALAIIGVLLGLVGVDALPGFGLLLVILPAQYALGALASRTRKDVVIASDARVQLMDEVLRAIKLVKCYGWEEPFARLVASYRDRETSLLAKNSVIKSLNLALVFVLPPLIALAIVRYKTLRAQFGRIYATLPLRSSVFTRSRPSLTG